MLFNNITYILLESIRHFEFARHTMLSNNFTYIIRKHQPFLIYQSVWLYWPVSCGMAGVGGGQGAVVMMADTLRSARGV